MDKETIQLVADLTTRLAKHDGCSRFGAPDFALLDSALKWAAKQKEDEPQTIRVFIEDGLVQSVTGIPEGVVVRKIDLDTEGSDENDGAYDLNVDDLPPDAEVFDTRSGQNPPPPTTAFVCDFLPDGTTESPYELETGGDAKEDAPIVRAGRAIAKQATRELITKGTLLMLLEPYENDTQLNVCLDETDIHPVRDLTVGQHPSWPAVKEIVLEVSTEEGA